MMKKLAIAMLALASNQMLAQDTITLEQVFAKALDHNFQIRMLENQTEIAENSATIGNAGLLPGVGLNAQAGGNITNTKLEFNSPTIPPTDVKGAQSMNVSAGANLNYTLFKGFSGKYTFEKLKLNAEAVDAQSRAAIEASMLQVANAYYVLSRAIDQITIAESNVLISKQRFERAELANQLGTALRTELLAARVDLTTDSSNLLVAQVNKENAERNLEQLVGVDLGENYYTQGFSVEVKDWTVEQLFEEAKVNNASLKNRELQVEMADKDYKIAWSTVFPTVTINGGYNYNNQQSETGIVLSNTQLGFNGAVALSYPIFNGFRNQIQRQNQKITMENRSIEVEQEEMQLATNLNNTWASYQQSLKVLNFEKSNQKSAELNLQRSEELYKVGRITSTQFREAQTALTASQVRISNAEISVKLNELELMRLSGQILSK